MHQYVCHTTTVAWVAVCRAHCVLNGTGDVFMAPIDSGAGSRPPFPYGSVPVYDFTIGEVRDAWVRSRSFTLPHSCTLRMSRSLIQEPPLVKTIQTVCRFVSSRLHGST